jgi:hypothetical protein
MGTADVLKVYAGDVEISASIYTVYDGTQTTPDSTIQTCLTAEGKTRFPVWKNLCYVVFPNYDLGSNTSLPNFTFEASSSFSFEGVPIMTSNISPSGVCSASSENGSNSAYKAFDKDDTTYWQSADSSYPHIIKYEFDSAKIVTEYSITQRADENIYYPTEWTFEGSNDNITWVVLDTQTGQTFTLGEKKTFTIVNTTKYLYYKVNITGTETSIILLLHCNGENGSTTFTDSAPPNHTVTAQGDAKISTALKEFGTGSVISDGSSDYLRVLGCDDMLFGEKEFIIDFWGNFTKPTGDIDSLFNIEYSNSHTPYNYGLEIILSNTGKILFYLSNGVVAYAATNNTDICDGYFHHVLVTRYGNNLAVAIDGNFGTPYDLGEGFSMNTRSSPDCCILSRIGGSLSCIGYMDEIRVVSGIGQEIESFSPPESEYEI